jgi:hypothetical protein
MTGALKVAMQILRFVGSSAVEHESKKEFLTGLERRDYTRAVF